MLRIYREGGGRGPLGLEVERWDGIVRDAPADPMALKPMTDADKKVRHIFWVFLRRVDRAWCSGVLIVRTHVHSSLRVPSIRRSAAVRAQITLLHSLRHSEANDPSSTTLIPG
jgi:hypothetical protein